MGRFLLGLLVASGLFWAYNSWGTADAAQPLDTAGGDPKQEEDPLQELENLPPAAGQVPDPTGTGEKADPVTPAPATIEAPENSAEPELDPSPPSASKGSIAKGFIHSPEGRAKALQAQAAAMGMEPAEALRRSTIILEHCMRESIQKDQAAEKALIEELYRNHLALVRQVAFNPANGVRALHYRVAAGDSLDKIASRYRKSHGIQLDGRSIATINRIRDPRSLQKDQLLRIPTDRIHVVVEMKSFLTAVYLGTDLVRLYWCSHGKPGHETPVTSFVVGEKIPKPDWYVKFKHDSFSGFGIHGTTEPDRMMEEVSLGCIRLRNEDIEEFFRLVPRGADVRVASS
jgi:lipoprotein-anchoring transpeptidase ErfK/SrfK